MINFKIVVILAIVFLAFVFAWLASGQPLANKPVLVAKHKTYFDTFIEIMKEREQADKDLVSMFQFSKVAK